MPKGLTVVLNQPGKPLELETLPTPEVEPGGVLIKNTAAAICGSDLHYWRNDGNYQGPDLRRVPGHEFTGVVHSLGRGVETDSLRRPLKEGDRVAFPFFNPCHRCYWCIRGEHHACPHRQRRSMQFTQQIKWMGLMHYNPWIMPAALDLLVRTKDKYPLSKVVSHSFPLAEVNKAFAFAEWQGKHTGTAATRVILTP